MNIENKSTEELDLLFFNPKMYTRSERLAYAKRGKYLSKLINDKKWDVRYQVARHGYGLNKLVNDKHWFVRQIAKRRLNKTKKLF